ncbi:putative signal transduction protein with CBS domains [Methanothermus fervidus DSM 2088]|uniref:Putative signal transduction protein with CBS domains n=1 Tax=Methanothermus fervidus (strain ATCC 43054 / DSM 2088 / JCM 10308 / V24 S) TaxID=523846 RepID=E3GYC1_METFV|nr:CBS domain-containing protein [Methanothermus fervidus]ADP77303.1 putative signal transduction protein with CBS domains [Methanothermus fervidus DSM 2088]
MISTTKKKLKDLKAQDIMIKDVLTANPDDTVAAAKLKMVRANVGGLPVVKNGKLVGLITHRDILLAGKEALNLRVKDLMSKNLVVVGVDTSIKEISKIMSETGYQRIPVVINDNKLVGLITQSCIIRAVAKYLD